MGTYVWYSGAADYPLEKRKRIKENILKILDAGGMMQIGTIKNNIVDKFNNFHLGVTLK